MIVKAEQRHLRISPYKVRPVANAVKDLPLAEAIRQLSVNDKKGSLYILKVIRQAVANAVHNFNLNAAELTIDSILVGHGATYKRAMAAGRGRSHAILKRTTHIRVTLKSAEAAQPVVKAEAKSEVKAEPTAEVKEKSVKKAAVKKPAAKKTTTKKVK